MAVRVVTVAHATGAGGDAIGRAIADRLGFRHINEEIVSLAAEKEGLDAELVADEERRKGFLARLFAGLAQGPMVDPGALGGAVALPEAPAAPPSEHVRALITAAIRETAERGQVVIVSHAAAIPLAGRPDVLRVLVTASIDTRVARMAQGGRSQAEAAKLVRDSDAGRADYFHRFYRIERELPTHYDLVLNTDALTADEAVDIAVAAARRRA